MNIRTLKSDGLLLLTAIIWGSAFVAQRSGMEHVGPFTYNGIRFALGSLSFLPLLLWNHHSKSLAQPSLPPVSRMTMLLGCALAGFFVFIGASLQQVGIVYTTAGKAGFITGLYVVIVPILGLLWQYRVDRGIWLGAALAAVGLYLLSITEDFDFAPGDLLVLVGAFFWAGHVLIIGWLAPRMDSLKLAFAQSMICSLLSLATAFFTEQIALESIKQAAIPILYGGFFSVGVAYTLQVVAQQNANPAHAAILLSMESVFAAIAGWLLLSETLSARGIAGCLLMLSGMLLSQLSTYFIHSRSEHIRLHVEKSAG